MLRAPVRLLRKPTGVAAAVLAAYVVWALWFAAHHPLVDLARVGSEFQGAATGESAPIDALADDTVDERVMSGKPQCPDDVGGKDRCGHAGRFAKQAHWRA